MSANEILVVVCAMLAVTACSVLLFHRLGLGSILGFLLVGIAVGPHTPGFVLTRDVTALRELTEIGVALLLFVVGLEVQPRRLWAMRRQVFGLGIAQLVVTTALLAAASAWWLGDLRASLLVGFALAMSSTAVVMQILEDRGELTTEHGRDAFGVLLCQDLAVIPVLAAVPLLAGDGAATPPAAVLGTIAVLVALWLCGRWLVPLGLGQSARARSLDAFSMVSLLAALGAAWATHAVGGSLALGAFVMGTALSESPYRHQVEVTLAPYKSLLLGLFFIAVGMSIDVARAAADPLPTALGVAALVTIQVAVMVPLGGAMREDDYARLRGAQDAHPARER